MIQVRLTNRVCLKTRLQVLLSQTYAFTLEIRQLRHICSKGIRIREVHGRKCPGNDAIKVRDNAVMCIKAAEKSVR